MSRASAGPWSLELRQSLPFGVVVSDADGRVVHESRSCHSTAQRSRADNEAGLGFPEAHATFTTAEDARQAVAREAANARLIAAAPELLEALAKLEKTLQFFHDEGCRPDEWLLLEWAQGCRKAIAKATQP